MVLEKPAFTVVDLQRQFKLLDTNGDGLLTFDEFVQAITHVGRSEEEAKKMAKAFFNLCDLVSRLLTLFHATARDAFRPWSYFSRACFA